MSKKKFTFQPTEVDKETVEAVNAVPESYPVTTDEIKEAAEEQTPHDVVDEPIELEAIVDGVKSSLNVREEPKVAANNQVGILGKGEKILVIDPEKRTIKDKNGVEWYRVRIGDGSILGYAMAKFIKIL